MALTAPDVWSPHAWPWCRKGVKEVSNPDLNPPAQQDTHQTTWLPMPVPVLPAHTTAALRHTWRRWQIQQTLSAAHMRALIRQRGGSRSRKMTGVLDIARACVHELQFVTNLAASGAPLLCPEAAHVSLRLCMHIPTADEVSVRLQQHACPMLQVPSVMSVTPCR